MDLCYRPDFEIYRSSGGNPAGYIFSRSSMTRVGSISGRSIFSFSNVEVVDAVSKVLKFSKSVETAG